MFCQIGFVFEESSFECMCVTAAMNASTHQILSGGFASKIFYKELFLDIEVLEGMTIYTLNNVPTNEVSLCTLSQSLLGNNRFIWNAGLKSEQSALVDFLVLANCSSFVGFGRSSFSFFLQYYKTLHNYQPAVSVLVGEIPPDMKRFATIP